MNFFVCLYLFPWLKSRLSIRYMELLFKDYEFLTTGHLPDQDMKNVANLHILLAVKSFELHTFLVEFSKPYM